MVRIFNRLSIKRAIILLLIILVAIYIIKNRMRIISDLNSLVQLMAFYKYYYGLQLAMKFDTYGGQTPQETLDLFIDALKKGDVKLASKYFVLREDGSRDPEILDILKIKKSNGSLPEIINIAQNLKPVEDYKESENAYSHIFITPDDQGMAQSWMIIVKNKYSQLWKIERF